MFFIKKAKSIDAQHDVVQHDKEGKLHGMQKKTTFTDLEAGQSIIMHKTINIRYYNHGKWDGPDIDYDTRGHQDVRFYSDNSLDVTKMTSLSSRLFLLEISDIVLTKLGLDQRTEFEKATARINKVCRKFEL